MKKLCLWMTLTLALGALWPQHAAMAANQWKWFTSKEGRFQILMPRAPAKTSKPVQSAAGTLQLYTIAADSENASYIVMYVDYPEQFVKQRTAAVVLSKACANAEASTASKELSRKSMALGANPGLEVKLQSPQGTLATVRLYMVNARLYQIVCGTNAKTASTLQFGKFLDSFKLL